MNLVNHILDKNINRNKEIVFTYKKEAHWENCSWEEFINLVGKTSQALLKKGVKPGDNIAIFSSNMLEWFIFDFAIMSIGAVSIPIFSTLIDQQLKYILDETETKLILVGDQMQYNELLKIYAESKFLETIIVAKDIPLKNQNSYYFWEWIKEENNQLKIEEKDKEDLLTIIYTSGTTGTPKGVMLTHNNFIEALKAHKEFFKFNLQNENSLCFLPMSHVFEKGWSMIVLYLQGKISILENPKEIQETLLEVKPTLMASVPRLYQKAYSKIIEKIRNSNRIQQRIFHQALKVGARYTELKRNQKNIPKLLEIKNKLADYFVFKKVKNQFGGKLWFMPVGGASLAPEITSLFDAIGMHLSIGYGLTETTATVSAFPFTNYVYPSVGKPLKDIFIKIGENNEILIKGASVMKGYYKKPEETKEVFINGWLRTGDAGCIDEQGNIYMQERIKDLIKTSNGKYVAPQMLENMLLNDNYIQYAMVVGDNHPYITAILVPNFEELKKMAAEKFHLHFSSLEELINLQKIKDFYNERIQDIQKSLANFEQIKKFTLLPNDFTMESGELTPTLKLRRKIITEKFASIINKMYQ